MVESTSYDEQYIETNLTVMQWLVDNISPGENFKVYIGDVCNENEISRNLEAIDKAREVTVIKAPAGGTALVLLAAVVISVAVTSLLAPDEVKVNRTDRSPNNSLSDRRNKARPNERIVDLVGQDKCIPDVLQQEYSIFNNNTEERYGYYCIARNQVQVEQIKDGDTLIEDITGASAGVYYPNKSPNNSTPDIQIGDAINREVVGVYQSPDAIGQVLRAPNEKALELNGSVRAYVLNPGNPITERGVLEDTSGDIDFSTFSAEDTVSLQNFEFFDDDINEWVEFGQNTSDITGIVGDEIAFLINTDPSWDALPPSGAFLRESVDPIIVDTASQEIGPFKITSTKVNTLLVNIYAPNGIYKENNNGRKKTTVQYRVNVTYLDDNLDPAGTVIAVIGEISGSDASEKGVTEEIDLGFATYLEFSVERITDKDYAFNGNVVDDIKLKDVFGLFDIDKTNFGNITTVQTKRTANSQAGAIRAPEINCIATELVYKYLGGGVFDSVLSANQEAMQSLIRVALDPYIGRRTVDEIDLDLLLSIQTEITDYFENEEAGYCSYSFDDQESSAQEILFTIANAAFTVLWREGRVLKAFFESPQTIPSMVFTHKSKREDSETWSREFISGKRKDSIEFEYKDDKLFTKETLYFPADRSGTNPLKVKISGIKGLSQATWRMMREYNKLKNQNISLEFQALQEGVLVKPQRLISVVKGSRTATTDGYVMAVDGLTLTLSQNVTFTDNDDHFVILKRRDGSVEVIQALEGSNPREIILGFAPSEAVYTGNDEQKTEFSFGNEARLMGQLMLPQEINPADRQYVTIKAINYSDEYYKDDTEKPIGRAFSDGFDEGFS